MTTSAELAAFVTTLDWDRMPDAVQDRTAELVLDYVGVTLAGSLARSSESVGRLAGPGTGAGRSSIIGRTGGHRPELAALINGTMGHALELDDVVRASSLHPGVVVIPAGLAVAEDVNVDVSRFGSAVVAGYEVAIRVGNALNPASAYERGFHPTGVAGVFGAAACASLLLDLDRSGITSAIGIAGTMASGSLQYLGDGAWTKRLNAGWAAHAGVIAAQLAAAGFVGPSAALDGDLGFLHAYSDDPKPELLLDGIGGEHAIMTVALKPYACCRYCHGLIDAMLAIRSEEDVSPDEIERIRLGVLSGGYSLVASPIEQKRRPRSVVEAQFSAPYAAAVALLSGEAGPEAFSEARLGDPRAVELMSKMECFASDELDREYPTRWPALVEIDLKGGRRLTRRIEYAFGEPENPMGRDALLAKFEMMVGDHRVPPDLAGTILDLDPTSSVAAMFSPLRTAAPA